MMRPAALFSEWSWRLGPHQLIVNSSSPPAGGQWLVLIEALQCILSRHRARLGGRTAGCAWVHDVGPAILDIAVFQGRGRGAIGGGDRVDRSVDRDRRELASVRRELGSGCTVCPEAPRALGTQRWQPGG